ncbi:MAG: ORF6N domain-containing protein [Bacteroidaceae bacterium]|nr:ORF6N domain-containing protein [Bacteroidaceae bacterium]
MKNINIESLIRIIRGHKVMLDADLAMLYGVTTSRLNEQVKRNINRFPDDFMFQVTKEEWNAIKSQIVTLEDLKSQNVTSKSDNLQSVASLTSQIATLKTGRGQHRKFLPHVFTRNGIGMLSSVLRSETAVEVNIRIMRAFTAIPDIVNNNVLMMQRILNIEQHQTETDQKVNQILTTIEKRLPEQLPEQIFATGCVWDAWTYVSDLVRSAKQRIVLIDNYVDDRVLSLLDKRADGVEATIHSRYYEPFQTDLQKHNAQYREIKFVQLPQKNHDRFLIIDDDVYLLGASVKDIGVGMCAVTKMQISPELIMQLLK